jgi:hypothetical protein
MDIDYRMGPMRAEDYDALRVAVGWSSDAKPQIEESLRNSLMGSGRSLWVKKKS